MSLNKLQQHIQRNELTKAFALLQETSLSTKWKNRVINLHARWENLQVQRIQGVLKEGEYELKFNQLRVDCLDLVGLMNHPLPTKPKQLQWHQLLLLLIAILLLSIGLFFLYQKSNSNTAAKQENEILDPIHDLEVAKIEAKQPLSIEHADSKNTGPKASSPKNSTEQKPPTKPSFSPKEKEIKTPIVAKQKPPKSYEITLLTPSSLEHTQQILWQGKPLPLMENLPTFKKIMLPSLNRNYQLGFVQQKDTTWCTTFVPKNIEHWIPINCE